MLIKARVRVTEVIFGMLLAVAIFALGGAFWSSRYEPRQQIADTKNTNSKQTESYWSAVWDWVAHDATGFFTFALVGVGAIQIAVFVRQLRLIRQGLQPAESAAKAALLQAEAVMTAEGAQLYPVIESHNLKEVFGHKALILNPSNPDTMFLETPKAIYRFKNYGKTPAKLILVMDNIEFRAVESKQYDVAHRSDESAIEIIGAGQESDGIECQMMAHFTWKQGHDVLNDLGELILSGQAHFKDFFDRQFICEWRCIGSRSGFKLVSHQQRPDPDAK